jgi:RimJ/RimL family protein N-acetyltransferase
MVAQKKSFVTPSGRKVILRQAVGKDAERIIDLINSVGSERKYIVIEQFSHSIEWEKSYLENLDPSNIVYYVAVVKRQIAGIISIERDTYPKTYHTGTLGMIVLKGFRREGVGSKMIEMALDWARDKMIEKVCLQCFATNEPAIALYRKYGFVEEGRRKGQFKVDGEYVDEVMMAKWIQ